jgi:predicted nucleotidyltransferase
MQNIIIEKLKEIERNENIKILLAVESGSRAWGFASSDSDYDVRFIYVRPKEFYLRLDKTRDVIELPINDELDINGWDLKKALTLLHNSNPTLFEWLSSPIVYCKTDFMDNNCEKLNSYFSAKKSLYHYLHMAENNNREFLRDDIVKLKKYFYVLRPILACKWILEHKSQPPMRFEELLNSQLSDYIRKEVDELLKTKINSPEIKMIKRVEKINDYIEYSITEIKQSLDTLPPEQDKGWDELNDMFLSELHC